MALSIRLRGKVWHARGTIRVGREVIHVSEFSTGQGSRNAALQAAELEAARIRNEALDGRAGRSRRLTVADCLVDYLGRPGGVVGYDRQRVAELNELIGGRALADVADGWQDWLRAHPDAAPGTAQRWRTVLAAALRYGCEARGVPVPPLPAVRQSREVRVVYLTTEERERLLAAYNAHAACPVLVLAYQGVRTQEALRLDWRRVDLRRETLHIPPSESKSGRGRTVPMHARVVRLLDGLWHGRGMPQAGPVFLSRRGEPYRDTRIEGTGNPLAKAHASACATAGVSDFRVHDWRHDWAARHVMAGTDLYTLMQLGGWSTMRMVERYASITADHMREAARRIA